MHGRAKPPSGHVSLVRGQNPVARGCIESYLSADPTRPRIFTNRREDDAHAGGPGWRRTRRAVQAVQVEEVGARRGRARRGAAGKRMGHDQDGVNGTRCRGAGARKSDRIWMVMCESREEEEREGRTWQEALSQLGALRQEGALLLV